ncbi:ATP-binding cassette domain-containing protein [Alkalibaculum sp. M08DMB]|uniref:ATP-binding cassette domain-containing protein n=1 Tax=Alkalibaculum sporogenes TaxID=2655001 RepID=A0A6A7K7Z8_9FIRM|nr:ABC transporter ATP-binding protein [Alkalibaculum sporogenes]MPW25223.1 ATP-binding cassette domain-containing protein [Alkalibaculum sporogenes]
MKLKLISITKNFGEKRVLKNIDFEFDQGKIYALLGRNGAGKTTLFNIVAKELEQDEGMSLLIEEDGSERELSTEDYSYMYSTPILPGFLTGYEFIKFFWDINEQRVDSTKTIDDYFDMIQLDEADRHRLVKGYSHGMKNKLQMMMFLIASPMVILMDEPLTSLDVVVASEIKNLIRSIRSDHIILFSTHMLQLAMDLCDEIVVLHNGALRLIDHEMLKDPNFEAEVVDILREVEDV